MTLSRIADMIGGEIVESFVFYTHYADIMKKLTPEQAVKLLYAICDYVDKGIEPVFDDIASDVCFAFIRTKLDKDITKYETTCQKRAEAGRKGAVATNSKRRQDTANTANAESDDKKEDIVEVADTESIQPDNSSEKETHKKKTRKKKEPEPEKVQYAEFVRMREQDYQTLVAKHGEDMTEEFISTLNYYKGAHKRSYADDYYAICSWVIDSVKKKHKKEEENNQGGSDNHGRTDTDIDSAWQNFERSTGFRKPND